MRTVKPTNKPFAAETELGAKVVAYLESNGYDVYQEVTCLSRTYDIVAIRPDSLVWVVECKLTLGLQVIEQAYQAATTAHYVSVAVPNGKDTNTRLFARQLLRNNGIGVIESGYCTRETIPPKLHRESHDIARRLRDSLTPEHKVYAKAGSQGGGRLGTLTPFKLTMQRCKEIIEANEGITTKALVRTLGSNHHYASNTSALSALPKWLDSSFCPWCVVVRIGRQNTYWTKEGYDNAKGMRVLV